MVVVMVSLGVIALVMMMDTTDGNGNDNVCLIVGVNNPVEKHDEIDIGDCGQAFTNWVLLWLCICVFLLSSLTIKGATYCHFRKL